jgi:hypothetical protein
MVEQAERHVETPADAGAAANLEALRAKARPTRGGGTRPPLYNAPDRWYAHPTTGDIVRLQGDASSQAYYVSKGFYLLTPEEAREWERDIRPLVVAEQRKRAAAITTLRRIAARHPGVEIAGDLDVTPTDELLAMLQQLQQMTGGTVAVIQGRFREDVGADEPVDRDVTVASGADLQSKLERAGAGAAEGRGRRAGRFEGAGAAV